MINEDLLFTRADSSDFMMSNKPVLLLAHGAGAPMDSEFMNRISIQLSEKGVIVIRFEFPYMRERRSKGRKKPPDNMQILLTSFYDTLESISHLINKRRSLFIGGKSMGGRVATMLLSCEPHDHFLPAKSRAIVARVKGCVCLGFPFHPAAKPEKAEKRVRHLAHVKQPVLLDSATFRS